MSVQQSGGGGGKSAGSLLASGSYNPGTQTAYASPSNQTFADIDATNITLTFVAPPSGNVIAMLNMGWQATANGQQATVTARVSPVAGSSVGVTVMASALLTYISSPVLITGLTASTSYTVVWRFACAAAGQVANAFAGGNTTAGQAGAAIFWVMQL